MGAGRCFNLGGHLKFVLITLNILTTYIVHVIQGNKHTHNKVSISQKSGGPVPPWPPCSSTYDIDKLKINPLCDDKNK